MADQSIKLLTKQQGWRLDGEEQMSSISVPGVSDEALPQDFEEIFREHAQLMYRTAFSVTGSRQDAEDVLQTVFLKLLQRKVPIEFRTRPKTYLYRAAVNTALDIVRARTRRNFTHDVENLQAPAPRAVPSSDDDIQRRLLDAIAQLRPRAVEILILRYEHNYSDAEIAKMLGKSRGVVAVTLYRTRARLKRLMFRTLPTRKDDEGR